MLVLAGIRYDAFAYGDVAMYCLYRLTCVVESFLGGIFERQGLFAGTPVKSLIPVPTLKSAIQGT